MDLLKIFIFPEYNLSVGYGKDWLLVSDRKAFKKYFDHVVHSRLKSVYPRWRRFIQEKLYAEKSLQMSVMSDELRAYGVESALLASSSDSMSLTLHTRVTNMDTIPFSLRDSVQRFDRTDPWITSNKNSKWRMMVTLGHFLLSFPLLAGLDFEWIPLS